MDGDPRTRPALRGGDPSGIDRRVEDSPTGQVEIHLTRDPACKDIPYPQYQTAGSSGLDIRAAVRSDLALEPGEIRAIPTGLRLAFPPGYEGQLRPRSGLALSQGLTLANSPGTIDADYRGEVQVVLINLGRETVTIRRGDRVAQLVVAPVARARVREVGTLDPTKRGRGGFGHTGL